MRKRKRSERKKGADKAKKREGAMRDRTRDQIDRGTIKREQLDNRRRKHKSRQTSPAETQ